jgi:hypothetical protein
MTTLIVGPIGNVPWLSAEDVAQRLHADLDLITFPRPYKPRRRADTLLPFFLVDRLRAFLSWRKAMRPVLASYDTILVWDPLVAVMLRLTRPRTARVVWTRTPPVVDDAWNAVLLRLARTLCDRVIAVDDDEVWFSEVRS